MSVDATPATQTEEIQIDKLVYGGDGLGRLPEGEVFFVPWSAPGDRALIERLPGTQKPSRGRIETLINPSPDRTEARCSVFGACGGCQWQHMTPAAQRTWKRNIVVESLQRIGKIENPPVLEVLGSDEASWRYRNRVQWEIEPEGDTLDTPHHKLGYYQAQSHDVVEFDVCHIIPAPLNQIASWLREALKSQSKLASGVLRIEAFINQTGQVLITLEADANPDLQTLARNLQAAFPQVLGVVHMQQHRQQARYQTLAGQNSLNETLGGQSYRISAGSFFQTNTPAAEKILETLDAWLQPETASLLDLYAGVGVFSIHLNRRIRRILAIESSLTAMQDAQHNLQAVGAHHIALKTGDARRILKSLNEKFDAAIVDPPRSGCQPEVLHWLNQHIRKQLLYVSCNPTTLARDLKTLIEVGWKLEQVQPIDMFPQTYHIETVVSLRR